MMAIDSLLNAGIKLYLVVGNSNNRVIDCLAEFATSLGLKLVKMFRDEFNYLINN